MTRGLACSICLTIVVNTSVRARRRSAAAGISAVSRPIALSVCGSAIIASGRVDGGAQIAPMALQQLRSFAMAQSEAEQDGRLYVAVRLFEIACRIAFRTPDDFADHSFCAPASLGVPRPHVH